MIKRVGLDIVLYGIILKIFKLHSSTGAPYIISITGIN